MALSLAPSMAPCCCGDLPLVGGLCVGRLDMARPVAVHTYRGGGNAASCPDQAVKSVPLRA
jgi:hypothetical protein